MNENGFQDKNLAELGEILRRTREEKGISLEDVVKDTKIPRRHLMAIESGSIDELPGKAFARCFIKEYLNYLKLERLWPQYDSLVALDEQVEISQVLGTYTPPPKGFKTTSRWWVYAVLIVLLVTSGGLLYVRREHIINVIKQQSQIAPSEEIAKETIKTPEDILTVLNETEGVQGKITLTDELKEKATLPSTPLLQEAKEKQKPTEELPKTLEITAARGNCWIRVLRGDEKIYEGTLRRNESKTFETKNEPLRVRFGNFSTVDIKWMGKVPEIPDKRASVITLLYQADGKVVKVD